VNDKVKVRQKVEEVDKRIWDVLLCLCCPQRITSSIFRARVSSSISRVRRAFAFAAAAQTGKKTLERRVGGEKQLQQLVK
jgi:hypothetical protein